MPAIKILPDHLINLIAAGEVVERPASVVKELVENSIDAGADQITIEIVNAGFEIIRISDNGSGMNADDARLAFNRHATSKISSMVDLEKIHTFGFRGEALAAIAAVAKINLQTKLADSPVGFGLKIEGGKIVAQNEIGIPTGTTITVCELFFNTPARRKFMRSQNTEQSHITEMVENIAIANPGIRFKLTVNDRELFICPATKTIEERIGLILGKTFSESLMTFKREAGNVWMSGILGGNRTHYPTRHYMRFFVNHRPIENRHLGFAVIQAYKHYIPEKRFPLSYVFIDIPPDKVDVNVHPTKREVKFLDESAIFSMLHATLADRLKETVLIPTAESFFRKTSMQQPRSYPQSLSFPATVPRYAKEAHISYTAQSSHPTAFSPDSTTSLIAPEERQELNQDQDFKIVGQVGRTYIAGQDADGFFLIDQHAAHERILYERFCKWPQNPELQLMLIPITFDLPHSQINVLNELLNDFKQLGMEIAFFSGNSYIIQTKPSGYESDDIKAVICEIIEWYQENGGSLNSSAIRDRMLKSLACKAAVKAGQRMQNEAMVQLFQQVLELPKPITCPHGRPIMFRLSWLELDKLFKRK